MSDEEATPTGVIASPGRPSIPVTIDGITIQADYDKVKAAVSRCIRVQGEINKLRAEHVVSAYDPHVADTLTKIEEILKGDHDDEPYV